MRNKVLCDNLCVKRNWRFTYLHRYNYHIADREPAFVCALRDSNPWTFTQPWSNVGFAFGVDWTPLCSTCPPPKTRLPISCRSVNRDVGWGWRWSWKSARGTGPKKIRWRPAAWDSSTWRTLHEVGCRWYLLTGALSSAMLYVGARLFIPKQNHDPYRPHFYFDQRHYPHFELFQFPERLA